MQLTRRKLLAGIGIGALGTGGVAGVALGRTGRPRYSRYAYAASPDLDDRRVRVAWYEQYNGVFLENQNGTTDDGLDATVDPDRDPAYLIDAEYVTDATGPVVALGNVLPGDEGTLVVALEAVDDASLALEPLDVWLQTAITADSESGINGPEQAALDTTTDAGELADELFVELWRDGSPLGSCNGVKNFGEQLESPVVELASIREAFGPTAPVGGDTGVLVVESFRPGESRCFALSWAFPLDVATNRSQGDSVSFAITFGAVPSGSSSPFSDSSEGTDGR